MAERRDFAAAVQLAAIVDSSFDAIVSKDLNGIILSWNRGAERIFGYTAEEAVGQSITLIIPEDRRPEEADVLRRIRAGEVVEPFETERRRKDGTQLPVSLTISPILDSGDGTVIGASKIARDISERRRNEALVADLQRRLMALIAASGSILSSPQVEDVLPAVVKLANELLSADGYAIWRLGGDGTWRIVSAAGLSETFQARRVPDGAAGGLTTTEPVVVEDVDGAANLSSLREAYDLEGVASMIVVPMQIGSSITGTLAAYYRRRRPFKDLDVHMARALGNLAAVAITTAELYDAQRLSRDEAERANRRAAMLSEVSAVLAGSLDYETTLTTIAHLAVPQFADWCAVDIVDGHGVIRRLAVAHVNPAKVEYARTLQERYPDGRDSPQGIDEVIRTGRSAMVAEIPDTMIVAAARDEEHLRIIRELGPTSYIAVPLRARGRTLGALTFVWAESGRHYDDDDLRFAEELAYRAALAVDNAHAYRDVSAANRAKDEFLATLSHELRTPLNAVLGWSRMLRDGGLREERRAHALAVIERNAEAQLRLVEDLLDVSRIITGKFRLDVQAIDLSTIIDAAIEAVQPAATAKGIRLQRVIDPNTGPVYGDGSRLQQAVWNLLANAVKFTPREGRVEVVLRRVASRIEIEVNDTGEGLTAEVLPFVFDRFRQADSGTSRGHAGLGLGLAIVRHIVELHGGSVSASSAGTGKGSSFRIMLPVSATALHSSGVHPAVGRGTSAPAGPVLRGIRVLVVEDDVDSRDLVASLLANCDAEVNAVAGAADAFAELDAGLPDVIISDIEMPTHDGYEFIRQLRTRRPEDGGTVPAIALTAYARPEDRARSLIAGFQLHLSKPVDFDELIAAVSTLGGKRRARIDSARTR